MFHTFARISDMLTWETSYDISHNRAFSIFSSSGWPLEEERGPPIAGCWYRRSSWGTGEIRKGTGEGHPNLPV